MKHDYDLSQLKQIKVRGFDYNIMPRYLYHYTDKDYERFSLDLLDLIVADGGTAIDIGAHYGIYSLLAARKSKKVYAFEPVPENFEVLKRNIAANNLQDIIEPINKAVSDEDGTVEFNVTWASDSAGFYEHPNAEIIRKIKVQMAAVDHELKAVKDLSFVKIDTEGHEIHVLKGMRSTLRNNRSAKLLIEFNPECLTSAGTTSGALVDAIIDLGYDIFAVHEDQRYMVRVTKGMAEETILQGLKYLNFLCLPVGSWQTQLLLSHSSDLGGAEHVLLDTVKGLIARTDKFIIPFVVLPGDGPLQEKIDQLPVPMQVIHMRGWTGSAQLDAAAREENRRMNSNAVISLSKIFSDFQPQVAYTNTMVMPWCALVAKSYDVPHIWGIHEFGDLDHGLDFDYGYEKSLRFIDMLSDSVIVNSKAVQKYVGRYINPKKFQLLYPQAKEPQLSTKKVASPFSKHAELTLAIVGRVAPSKGQFDAVKALQTLRKQGLKAELLIVGPVGSSEYQQEIDQYCKQHDLGAYVHSVGYQENPADLLQHADVALVCSNNEAYGLVTVESMRLGKPVVAAASGGGAEIVADGKTGLLYEPGDVKQLASLLQKMTDSQVRTRLSEAGKKAALALVDDYTANFLSCVKSAIAGHVPASDLDLLIVDLFAGARDQQAFVVKQQAEFTQAHNEVIQDFSDKYNEVYEAYNTVSQQLEHLRQSKLVRVHNKLGSIKRKLGGAK